MSISLSSCPSHPLSALTNMRSSTQRVAVDFCFLMAKDTVGSFEKMILREIFCCQLFVVQVYLIQTPNLLRNVSFSIDSSMASELECLKTLITETFKYSDRSFISVTVTETEGVTQDLQSEIIRYLNQQGRASLELLGDPPHPEFESSTICFKESNDSEVDTCRNNFVLKESAFFYVIIAQGVGELQNSLFSAYNSSTFNPSGHVLIFWRHFANDSISDVLPILWQYHMLRVVLAEHDLDSGSLTVHVLQLKLFGPGLCLDKSKFMTAGLCKNMRKSARLGTLINRRMQKSFKNCTIEVLAMQYEPFVIDEDHGIEIKLLKDMGKHNNVTFDIQLTSESKDWGDKVNGTWDGNLGRLINTLKVGIGNVGPEADRLEDFDFSFSYKSPVLVWVVPIAKYVKKWRVLTIIFTSELWAVIFAVFLLTSGLFSAISRLCKDDPYLQSVPGSFLTSLQIMICSSVHRTPKKDLVRLVFLAGLLFSLILTCVYSSHLINVLTNVVREHQIQNEEDIVDSGLAIGGLQEYLERFKRSDSNDCLDEICNRYQFFEDEKDTAMFWLQKVQDREACTPLTKMFVQYYMVNRFEKVENETDSIYERTKRIKLFIIDKPINFYSLALTMSKGNPFKKSFDKFLKKFVESGLMYTLTVEYSDKFNRLKDLVDNSDEGPERLGIYHVQGPFAILGIGDCVAILVFLIEKLRKFKQRTCDTKNSNCKKVVRRDPTNKSLYYDKKYGDMYGRNFAKDL